MQHLKDLPVLILGLGASGLAMTRWCARHGAVVTVADTREAPAALATLQAELPGVTFIGGPFSAALIEGTAIRAVYRSPGLAPATIAPVVDAARAVGLTVGGELDLFARALLDLRTVEVPVVEIAEAEPEAAQAPAAETPAEPEPVLPDAQAELALTVEPTEATPADAAEVAEVAEVAEIPAAPEAPVLTEQAEAEAVAPAATEVPEAGETTETAEVPAPATEPAAARESTEATDAEPEPTVPAMAEAMPRDPSLSVPVSPPVEASASAAEAAAPAAEATDAAPESTAPAPATAPATGSRLPATGKPYVPTAAREAADFVAKIAELSATNPASAAVEEEPTAQLPLVPIEEPPEPKGYAPAVLAVTGTNGKTTVTSLTGQLVERSGRTVAVAGNIGPTLLDTLAERIASHSAAAGLGAGAVVVPARGAGGLRAHRGHGAERHPGPPRLARRHGRLCGRQGAHLRRQGADGPQPRRPHGDGDAARAGAPEGRQVRAAHRTSPSAPTCRSSPGDFGIEMVNGMAWLVRAHEADETQKRGSDEAVELHVQRLMPADALRIRGRHNAVNALAALALATAAGARSAPCCTACANTAASRTGSSRSAS
jgi:UDP-N-acetylmuramoylalanine--D-glutamate ligase